MATARAPLPPEFRKLAEGIDPEILADPDPRIVAAMLMAQSIQSDQRCPFTLDQMAALAEGYIKIKSSEARPEKAPPTSPPGPFDPGTVYIRLPFTTLRVTAELADPDSPDDDSTVTFPDGTRILFGVEGTSNLVGYVEAKVEIQRPGDDFLEAEDHGHGAVPPGSKTWTVGQLVTFEDSPGVVVLDDGSAIKVRFFRPTEAPQ